jgi:uncharacterized protein YcbX
VVIWGETVSVADEGPEAAAILSKFFNKSVKLVRFSDEKGRVPKQWNADGALNETAFADACVNLRNLHQATHSVVAHH